MKVASTSMSMRSSLRQIKDSIGARISVPRRSLDFHIPSLEVIPLPWSVIFNLSIPHPSIPIWSKSLSLIVQMALLTFLTSKKKKGSERPQFQNLNLMTTFNLEFLTSQLSRDLSTSP